MSSGGALLITCPPKNVFSSYLLPHPYRFRYTLHELYISVESVLRRLMDARLYAAAYTLALYAREIEW